MNQPDGYQTLAYLLSDQMMRVYTIAVVVGFAIGILALIAKALPGGRQK
jgi:energy-converting hydrogenase Eha subunit G